VLQATDDPSLLVPVSEVWEARGRTAAVLRRGGFNPREYLLAALGQAAAISPHVEQSLKSPAPAGFHCDAAAAREFLATKAWVLEQAGFGVLLPAWWAGKTTKVRLSMRANVTSPALQGGGGLSLEVGVRCRWGG